MTAQQQCNPAGIAIIIKDESFFPRPYRDSGGIWTIGYGHTEGVTADSAIITKDQAIVLLREDLATAEEAVERLVKYELTSNQFSALVSFVYNIGQGNFMRSSALLCLNGGDLDEVGTHMALWNSDHAGNVLSGLKTRRAEEVALFYTPDDPEPENEDESVS